MMENRKYQQAVEKAAQLAYSYESKYCACSQNAYRATVPQDNGGPHAAIEKP
jgi:hypothetical protein